MSNVAHHTVVVTRGPLSKEEQVECRRLPYGEIFIRLCALGVGSHHVTLKRLARLCRTSNRADITDIGLRLTEMQAATNFLNKVSAKRYGSKQREKVTVHVSDTTDFSVEGLPVQPDVEPTGDVLRRFLFEFKEQMSKRVDFDWTATGREAALAKRVIKQFGGLEAALDIMKRYFKMPPEWRSDDFSFAAFYANIPGILHIRDSERIEDYEQQRLERRAAARSKMPTDEDNAAFHEEAQKQIEENRRRKGIAPDAPFVPRRERLN